MGTTTSTIKIVNNTNTDIVKTSVFDMDKFDFQDSPNRPDRNLDKISILAKASIERQQDLFSPASHCPFTITLFFSDQTEDTFSIDLKYAVGCCHRFSHSKGTRKISHSVHDKKIIIIIDNPTEQCKEEKDVKETRREKKYSSDGSDDINQTLNTGLDNKIQETARVGREEGHADLRRRVRSKS
ncbi:hypothetical protein Zmor_017370 [Zophobas morio]|uniref:Uncharacterized protein n=1 Tax=Zophobas morio TaxID=2755281 RepID=A0AA38MC13_9CUCU|nr:hypothetical protein Zmor_017370 [Zophobas morio]